LLGPLQKRCDSTRSAIARVASELRVALSFSEQSLLEDLANGYLA
jgi:hypothetical protein